MEISRYLRSKSERYADLGVGTIYSFAEGKSKNQNTILVAIIDLHDGRKVTAQLTDFDRPPTIGEKVECITRKWNESDEGLLTYGYKFRPVLIEEVSMFSK